MLKNISEKFKLVLPQSCKISINTMQTPELWKKVIVRMIPKKMIETKKISKIIDPFQ
jgi:hypothetical protein